MILSLPVPAASLLCQQHESSYYCFQVCVEEILSTWKHPYTIKATVHAYCGNYIRGSCITCYSVKASSTIATLVNQSKTITRICCYHMAGVLTQASKQMIIQIIVDRRHLKKKAHPLRDKKSEENRMSSPGQILKILLVF